MRSKDDTSEIDEARKAEAAPGEVLHPTGRRSLTVFVPALNEEAHLSETIDSIRGALDDTMESWQIVIVNDGSSDRTPHIAEELAQRNPAIKAIHHAQRMGLGKAYMSAVEAATEDHFVFIPGDNSWPRDSITALFKQLGQADVVTSYATNPWARHGGLRRFISAGYTVALNIMHGLDLRYYNGLTIYPTAYLKTGPITTFGFGFAAEALLHAIYRGMSYVEVGVPIQELEGGLSKAVSAQNISSVAMTMLRLFWILRVRRVHGLPRVARRTAQARA
jgi:hypothetical protein